MIAHAMKLSVILIVVYKIACKDDESVVQVSKTFHEEKYCHKKNSSVDTFIS